MVLSDQIFVVSSTIGMTFALMGLLLAFITFVQED